MVSYKQVLLLESQKDRAFFSICEFKFEPEGFPKVKGFTHRVRIECQRIQTCISLRYWFKFDAGHSITEWYCAGSF